MAAMAVRLHEAARQRLAALVIQRRTELDMAKVDVAKAAGIEVNTYSKIEAGLPVRDTTYGKVERVFAWAPGSCRDVLDGGSPTPLAPAPVAGAVYADVPDDILDRYVATAVQNAAVAVSESLTAPEIRKLTQAALEEWRRLRSKNPGIDGN